jgi:hypothetical protein
MVAGWAAFIVALAAIPILHGYAGAPPGTRFSGFIGQFRNDYNSYLAWIRQAYDGYPTFRILFTTEPHARWFFHPLFWAMGTLARVTGLPMLTVWHLTQATGCIALVPAIYGFAARCTQSRTARILALVLATTASGFGWIWVRLTQPAPNVAYEQTPIDLWMAESSPFPSLVTSFITLPIALALLLGALNFALDHLESGRMRDAALGALLALALATTHPYDMLTLDAVLVAWFFLRGRHRVKGFALLMGLPLPFLLYALAVTRLAPVFSQVAWAMPMPNPGDLLCGLGLPLALGVAALLDPRVRRGSPNYVLPAAWLGAVVLLLLLPLGFQRKLLHGVTVPLCLLAAMGLVCWGQAALSSLRRPQQLAVGTIVSLLIVLFAAAGSAELYLDLLASNREKRMGDYLPEVTLDAMRWLEEHTEPADVVIATPIISPWLPGRVGVTVYQGHWAQTLDLERKRDFVLDLFSANARTPPEEIERLLTAYRVRYLVADRSSVMRYKLAGSSAGQDAGQAFRPWTRLAFKNADVLIWEVTGRPSASAPAP